MLYLLLGLLITAAYLVAFCWAGTFFFQGYIYTEPTQGLYWQAPAAGLMLTVGYAIWCFVVVLAPGVGLHKGFFFTPNEDMYATEPAARLWAIKSDRKKTGDDKDGDKIEYKRVRDGQKKWHYVDTSLTPRPWNPQGVIAIEMEKEDGTKVRFDEVKVGRGENRQFRSSDGWVIKEDQNGPTGNPERFRLDRLLFNVIFNLAHVGGWFVALCLLLRFQWPHALGLAVVLWLVITLSILPMMLGAAADVAAKRQTVTARVAPNAVHV